MEGVLYESITLDQERRLEAYSHYIDLLETRPSLFSSNVRSLFIPYNASFMTPANIPKILSVCTKTTKLAFWDRELPPDVSCLVASLPLTKLSIVLQHLHQLFNQPQPIPWAQHLTHIEIILWEFPEHGQPELPDLSRGRFPNLSHLAVHPTYGNASITLAATVVDQILSQPPTTAIRVVVIVDQEYLADGTSETRNGVRILRKSRMVSYQWKDEDEGNLWT